MRSIDRPISVKYTNSNYTNEFIIYHVFLSLWNDTFTQMSDEQIYEGRTWFNSKHETEILLSTIFRDHAFRNPVTYNNNKQLFVPENLGEVAKPIENASDVRFYTTNAKIKINGTQVANFPVTAQNYSHLVANKDNNAYDGTQKNLSLNSPFNILPHLPNVSTGNMWLGVNYAFWGTGTTLQLLAANHYLSNISLNKEGNYSLNLPLSTIVDATSGYDTDNEHVVLQLRNNKILRPLSTTDVAIFDNCPSDFYLFWNNSYGFFSFRCNGKTYKEDSSEHSLITDIYGAQHNLWTNNTYSWTLNTGVITDEYRAAFMTIMDAPNVWLYDTKLDKTFNVAPQTSSLRNLPEGKKADNINLSVKEIITHIN